jgi:hypothetical protein
MDRVASQAGYEVEPVDPSAETIINGVPYDARRAPPAEAQIRSDQPDGGLSDEIKRRQVALAVRYVAIARSALR